MFQVWAPDENVCCFDVVLERELKFTHLLLATEEHNYMLRCKPKTEYGLLAHQSSRGGQVEVIPLRHFASLGMRARLFLAHQMIGITAHTYSHNADQREKSEADSGADGDAGACKLSSVRHFRTWLRTSRHALRTLSCRVCIQCAYQQANRRSEHSGIYSP